MPRRHGPAASVPRPETAVTWSSTAAATSDRPLIRLGQCQQRGNEQRVKLFGALATAAVPADPAIGQWIFATLQLEDPLPHRRLTHPRGTRDGPDPAVPQHPGLGGQRQPLLPLIEMREQHPESQDKLVTKLARYAHTTPTTERP